jgi:hypothetical protein
MYINEKNCKNMHTVTGYYENEDIQRKGVMSYRARYKKSNVTGTAYGFDTNGSIRCQVGYNKSWKDGVGAEYKPNGILFGVSFYKKEKIVRFNRNLGGYCEGEESRPALVIMLADVLAITVGHIMEYGACIRNFWNEWMESVIFWDNNRE